MTAVGLDGMVVVRTGDAVLGDRRSRARRRCARSSTACATRAARSCCRRRMQKHLPPRPRFADRYHVWAIRHGFPILAWIAPRLNRRLARFLARCVIWAIFVVYPTSKRMLARNFARIVGLPERSWKARRGASAVLRHFAFYWVDLFRFAQLPPERGQGPGHGDRRFRARRAQLRGRQRARSSSPPTTASTSWAASCSGAACRSRWSSCPTSSATSSASAPSSATSPTSRRSPSSRSASWSSLPVLRALRAGRLVAMQGDRDFGGPRHPRDLLRRAGALPARAVPGGDAHRRAARAHLHPLHRRSTVRGEHPRADRGAAAAATASATSPPPCSGGRRCSRARCARTRRSGTPSTTTSPRTAATAEGAAAGAGAGRRAAWRPEGWRAREGAGAARHPGRRAAPLGSRGAARPRRAGAASRRRGAAPSPWEVEIGFGKGRYLLRRALAEPRTRFLGIELAGEYFRLLATRARRRGVQQPARHSRRGADAARRRAAARLRARRARLLPGPLAEGAAPAAAALRRRVGRPRAVAAGARRHAAGSPPTTSPTARRWRRCSPGTRRPPCAGGRVVGRGAAHQLRGEVPGGGAADPAAGGDLGGRRGARGAAPGGASAGARRLSHERGRGRRRRAVLS